MLALSYTGARVGDFKNLAVWREAHRLSVELYSRTRTFSAKERFELTRQIRRAAQSVGANLAEGCGRRGDREFRRFARIARGSTHEIEHHLIYAKDIGLLAEDEWRTYDTAVQRISRMLTRMLDRPPLDPRP